MSIEAKVYDFPEDDFEDFVNNNNDRSLQTRNNEQEKDLTVKEDNQLPKFDDYDYDKDFETFVEEATKPKTSEKEFSISETRMESPNRISKAEQMLKELEGKEKETEVESLPEDVYQAAFNFIKENNILNIPEGKELTAETLGEVLQYDQELRNMAALEYIKNRAGDSYVAELFELVWNGGTYNDLQEAKQIVDDESFINSVDPANEEHQRQLLDIYFRQGLNENIPSHKLIMEDIPARIDKLVETYKAAEETRKALTYFKQVINSNKENFVKEVDKKREEEEKEKAKKLEYEVTWRKSFINEVVNSNWAKDKKEEVIDHFGEVKLSDGTQLALWDYKMKKIWEKPELTKELFKFLADLDPVSLTFKTRDKSPINEATNMILKIAAKKAPGTKVNSYNESNDSKNNQQVSNEELNQLISKYGQNK